MYGSVAFLFFSFLAAASAQASTTVSVTGGTTAGGSTTAGTSAGISSAIQAATGAASSAVKAAMAAGDTTMNAMRLVNNNHWGMKSSLLQAGNDVAKTVINAGVNMAAPMPVVNGIAALGGGALSGGADVMNTVGQAAVLTGQRVTNGVINVADKGMTVLGKAVEKGITIGGGIAAQGAAMAAKVGEGLLNAGTRVSNTVTAAANMGANVAGSMSGRLTSGAASAGAAVAGAAGSGAALVGSASAAVANAQAAAAVPANVATSMTASTGGTGATLSARMY